MSSKIRECLFCGKTAKSTDEHVWAQWLHETPAAKTLLEGSHGARLPRHTTAYREDPDGRLQADKSQTGFVAQLLPNVKIPVCMECNSGWMSRLEATTKRALGPYIYNEKPFVQLDQADVGSLAGWAAKCIMAYYRTVPELENPFTRADYRAIARTSRPPDHSALWLLSSHHVKAQVSMGAFSTYFSFPDNDPAIGPGLDTPDNFGLAFVAVACCVFVMMRWPDNMPGELRDALIPPQLAA